MIDIHEELKHGDLVYAWFSPFKEKSTKKPAETEYRYGNAGKDHLKLEAIDGGYSFTFSKEMIETWYGNVRRVSK